MAVHLNKSTLGVSIGTVTRFIRTTRKDSMRTISIENCKIVTADAINGRAFLNEPAQILAHENVSRARLWAHNPGKIGELSISTNISFDIHLPRDIFEPIWKAAEAPRFITRGIRISFESDGSEQTIFDVLEATLVETMPTDGEINLDIQADKSDLIPPRTHPVAREIQAMRNDLINIARGIVILLAILLAAVSLFRF
jgi:hypothetical protein